jgi:long-chain fatty acid transport protein
LKRIIFVSIVTASALMATNGDKMIGLGAVNTAMGGTGVSYCTDPATSVATNPALLAGSKVNSAFSIDLTVFNPTVKATIGGSGAPEQENDFGVSYIPNIGYIQKVNEKLAVGLGVFGFAGMGVDYKNDTTGATKKMRAELNIAKIIPSISYSLTNDISIGLSPVLAYGEMALNYTDGGDTGTISSRDLSNDIGTGFTIGAKAVLTDNVKVGITYSSGLEMEYDNVANFEQFGMAGSVGEAIQDSNFKTNGGLTQQGAITDAGASMLNKSFDTSMTADNYNQILSTLPASKANLDNLILEQPEEFAIGITTTAIDKLMLSMDYRKIMWSDAKGYKEFGWKDQDVIAFGGAYTMNNKLVLRAGYNKAKSPIKGESETAQELMTTVNLQGHTVYKNALNMLNIVGFPAISETHYTLGFGYKIAKSTQLNFAYMYAPENVVAKDGTTDSQNVVSNRYSTSMEQSSYTIGIKHRW